jgi:hypothetical protein
MFGHIHRPAAHWGDGVASVGLTEGLGDRLQTAGPVERYVVGAGEPQKQRHVDHDAYEKEDRNQ